MMQMYTPLHVAAQMDRTDVAKLVGFFVVASAHLLQLLRHGASTAPKDPSGRSALDLARANQSTGVVRLLSAVRCLARYFANY